ncbi:MAG: dihydrofolate reductase [Intestinimonas sp.]|jgi:dihydrofolate reductase|nr:dihydrofolate reductase [Intestinimonas sp.]
MNILVAADQDWGIGNSGKLLVYIPADLKRFQSLTMSHPMILGRKTLSTFPGGKPLPGRRNLILSRTAGFRADNAEIFHDLPSLLAEAPEDSFVVGGGLVYHQLLPYCTRVYLTRLETVFPADVFFPDLDMEPAWTVTEVSPLMEHNGLGFRYITYDRKP